MKISITTHLPSLDIYFIETIAMNYDLEYVIVQKSKQKFSFFGLLLNIIPDIVKYILKEYKIPLKKYKYLELLAIKYKFNIIY